MLSLESLRLLRRYRGSHKKRVIRSSSEPAEKATRWLWVKRADLWVATEIQVVS